MAATPTAFSARKKLFDKISDPRNPVGRQATLLVPNNVVLEPRFNPFPPIVNDEKYFFEILDRIPFGSFLGLDYEYLPDGTPTVIGIADEFGCSGLINEDSLTHRLWEVVKRKHLVLVAHSGIGADKPVFDKILGLDTPLRYWRDSMLDFYSCYASLCKSPERGESDDAGSLGLMNLWTASSVCTMLSQYKICRGSACAGPCPRCQVVAYCAVDAWAGLMVTLHCQEIQLQYRLSQEAIWQRHEVTALFQERTDRGIRVDVPWIEQVEREGDMARAAIFPNNEPFNPNSALQVLAWFAKTPYVLAANDKHTILAALEKALLREGYLSIDDLEKSEQDPSATLGMLLNLHHFKSGGKGPSAWFGPKYRDSNRRVHPRFNTVGTSMGRLSSSGPNFTNIPSRGWAVVKKNDGLKINKIKAGVLPDQEDHGCVEADSAQLELRTVLWASGIACDTIGKDAFTWLVEQSNGAFEEATKYRPGLNARDLSKIASHSSDYLSGMRILYSTDLQKDSIKREIEQGSLAVMLKQYDSSLPYDWEYGGGVVAFSGGNLAEILFGDKLGPNRVKSLAIQKMYFDNFPSIRRWHMRILAEMEALGYAKIPTGRYLRLPQANGNMELLLQNARLTAAFWGQGLGSDYSQGVILTVADSVKQYGGSIMLNCHDSILVSAPKALSDQECIDMMWPMCQPTPLMPTFSAPIEIKRGPNYGELRTIYDPKK